MTPNRVQVAMEKFGDKIPADRVDSFRECVKAARNECMDTFMFIPTKSPLASILFSIFLGGFGVDRFYLGDVGLGLAKIFVPVALSFLTSLFSLISPMIGLVLSLATSFGILAWRIYDIFAVYKESKRINYYRLTSYLSSHINDNYKGAYSYSEEKRAQEQAQYADTTSVEQYEATGGEYTPLYSPYKPVFVDNEVQPSEPTTQPVPQPTPKRAPIVIQKPASTPSQLNVIFTCPVCGQKMRITTVASKYCCPSCTTIFPYKNVIK